MTKLIPRSKIQQKINSLKEGGSIPKYQNAGILKKIYYWRSPDYSKTEDGKQQSFSDAYALARNNNDDDFWWTDDKGNRNIYNTDFKLTLPQRDAKTYKQIRYDYLKAIENPNSVGYNPDTDRWVTPKAKGYDPYQIGIGLDTRTNKAVRDFLKKTGRTRNPWLTQQEMEQLQNQSLQYFEDILEKNTKGIKLSDAKRAITIGLLYHGHGPYLWKPNGPKTQRMHDALFNGSDKEFIDSVSDFYRGNSRSSRHSKFWDSNRKYQTGGPLTQQDKNRLWKLNEKMGANDSQQEFFNYWIFQKGDSEVRNYFNSYLDSPGFKRIINNQNEWWKSRHPYRKWYSNPDRGTEKWFQVAREVEPNIYTADMYSSQSFVRPIYGDKQRTAIIGRRYDDEFPQAFTIGHEYLHGKTPFNMFGSAPFKQGSAQAEALEMNTNTKKGHDSYEYEKYADNWGLKYLLYKEGIYDARENKDITVDQIKKLRQKYPELRPFKQMTDEQIQFQLNHVASINNGLNNNQYHA